MKMMKDYESPLVLVLTVSKDIVTMSGDDKGGEDLVWEV